MLQYCPGCVALGMLRVHANGLVPFHLSMKYSRIVVVWVMTPFSLVDGYQLCLGKYCGIQTRC
jgi:hypothetical protein